MEIYIRKVLRVSVAQICQTIGYNSFQSIPLELLVDSLQKFLQEFARDLHNHVELFNRTEANLDDVALSLQSLNISTSDLLEYINNVQPIACNIEIPQLPAAKSSNLNFLKPGSKEVLTRPVHIYEHLPPILRDNEEEEEKSNIILESQNTSVVNNNFNSMTTNELGEELDKKLSVQQFSELNDMKSLQPTEITNTNNPIIDVTSKSTLVSSSATREISSVMMTSGGFISPAIEGKTPESFVPDIVDKYFGLDAPPPPTPPSQPALSQSQENSEMLNKKINHSPTPSSQNRDQNNSLKFTKSNQNLDKKKKIKKKSLSNVTPNSLAVTTSTITDKAQRKRLKMLQKSMAKNISGNNIIGNLKSKTFSNLSHTSQEKHLKKQLKLKQKQIRQQNIQKQMESAPSNVFRNTLDKTPILSSEIEKPKFKKELSAVKIDPSLAKERGQLSEIESLDAINATTLSSSKAIHQQTLDNSQDQKAITSLTPMTQSTGGMQPSSLAQNDEVKLSNEPDRSKLNIFKKISSSGRKERGNESQVPHQDVKPVTGSTGNTTIFSDSQVISLPSGTTITPAPPSGSGRHVYAPPPSSSQQSSEFNSVISVDDGHGGGIPEGSAVLMKRGDLMIQKPKKRGRKPGSKNQPKILGMTSKKPKKMKKSFYGHHPSSNLMEPLNLSNNSINNIANIPLGIASTFPIDSGVTIKMKKERKKSKLGKDSGFMHNHSHQKSSSMVPTKEEFGSINQKLMMMNTVLQPAPPLPSNTSSSLITNKQQTIGRSASPSFSLGSSSIHDVDSAARGKKERKKQKLMKDQQKQIIQQGIHQYSGSHQTVQHSGKSSSPTFPSPTFPAQSFSNGIPGMDGMPMFPFYPFPARPGLIPSHNLFSQLPNMHNNGLFMPPLMGFSPLNNSIRSFLKDEKTNATPLPTAPEGSYSKVAPLVPDTMKLELSPNASSSKSKMVSPRGGPSTIHNNIESISLMSPIQVGTMRKKSDDHVAPLTAANALKNSETIEVSSDDSVQDEMRSQAHPTFTNRSTVPFTGIPAGGLYRLPKNASQSVSSTNESTIVENYDQSPSIERRNKEHKKIKKINKQSKKQLSPNTGLTIELKNTVRHEIGGEEIIDMSMESDKKCDEPTNLPGHVTGTGNVDYESSPEKRKDHKKMKKLLKETKIKKKKDKKEKNKNKEKNIEKIGKSEKSEKEKRKEEKKDKDKMKKLKKDKKKCKEDKERGDNEISTIGGASKYVSSGGDGASSSNDISSLVPKITLKLGQSVQSPTLLKTAIKSSLTSTGGFNLSEREQSPELARISPLVTRPPKQHKLGVEEGMGTGIGNLVSGSNTNSFHHVPSLSASLNILNDSVIDIDSSSGGPSTFMLPASATILGGMGLPQACTKTPVNNNSTISTLHNTSGSSNMQHTATAIKHSLPTPLSETNRPSSFVDPSTKDAEGNRVWICPACGKVDDGSPMIGCDGCDAWYHWVCVGILVAPDDNEDWYCRVCIAKKKGIHGSDKKRKRNKKKNSDF